MKRVNLDFTGYKGYEIDTNGVVYNAITNEELITKVSEQKTCKIVELNDCKTKRSFNVAGLVVKAYDIKKDDKSVCELKSKYKINYVDGDINNTSIDNITIVDDIPNVKLDFTGYKGYEITSDGIVLDSVTKEVVPTKLSELKTCKVVALNNCRTERFFNVAGLMVKAFNIKMETKGKKLSFKDYCRLKWKFKYLDGNVENTSLSNIQIINEKDFEVVCEPSSSRKLSKAILNNTYNKDILTDEEAYALIYNSVDILYSKKTFYSLNEVYTREDLASEIFMTLLNRNAFKKFNSAKASKKSYISTATRNAMIDMVRTQKQNYSFDYCISDGDDATTLADVTPDTRDLYEELISNDTVMQLIDSLPDTCNDMMYGKSPFIGTCKLTGRTVALHQFLGWKDKDIADMFISDIYNERVVRSRIRELKKANQEELGFFKDMMLEAM